MAAYSLFFAGITLALERQDDVVRRAIGEWDLDQGGGWRQRVAVGVAILLWLLVWLGGWWLGRSLSSGSILMATVGAFVGWCVGLGLATLILYMDERL